MLSATKASDLVKSGGEEDSLTSSMQRRSENTLSADNAHDSDKVVTRKINNRNSTSTSSSSSLSEKNDSSQEIAEGNCLVDAKGERLDGKIDLPKKRFFDLRRTAESASNKISSISPSRLAASLTPKLRRKSAANHKLSQLERASNLFIRDGSEANVNKQELPSAAAMEARADVNAQQHQQNSLEGNNPGQPKCKKSSIMPSFGFKIPSASPQRNVNKNLCTNFASAAQLNHPPPPPSDAFGNYEEIDIVDEDERDVAGRRRDVIMNAPDALDDGGRSNCAKASSETVVVVATMKDKDDENEFNSIESCGDSLDMLSKPEFSSNVFKNIPVRARKGQVPHMDNYCLFDPSVDFEAQRKKNIPTQFHLSSQNFLNFHVERQLVYDISEHDERQASLAHHNYYEIDPELLEKDESPPSPPPLRKTSSSSSCDYPLIETPSSTVTIDSPDEHEAASKLNIPTSNVAINHASVALEDDGNVITVSSVVSATGAKKKSPQFDRIVKQVARNPTDSPNQRQTTSGKSTRINLPFHNGTLSLDPLKSSHSLPQLQNITMRREKSFGGDYNIEINNRTTIHLRRSVKKVRPTSSESLDSGFTTPSPPNETFSVRKPSSGDNNRVNNSNSGANEPVKSESTVLTQCDNIQQLIEIYTEWANYYLERHKSKRKVTDLSMDARDGLLLAEIIEAVTSFKVPDLIKKPKSQQQMYDNVEACLVVLRNNSVPGVENVTANDIIGGRLKAVLSLFFSLSRFKQASKLKAPNQRPPQAQPHSSQFDMMHATRQLPVYTKSANGATAIPLPATVLVTRRCPPDKVRPLPPTPNHQSSIPLTKPSSNESSRPNSPPENPKNGIRSNCKIPTSPYSQNNGSLLTNSNLEKQNQQPPAKQSMLGKLKLFGKDKTEVPKTQLSKRTSSSSGFSSARSERSDSSMSLNNDSALPSSQTTSTSSTKSSTNKADAAKATVTKTSSKVTAPAKTATKGDKKDKSQLSIGQSECNGINADSTPPTKMHKIPQAKLQVSTVGRKPESTATKTGLSSQLQQPKPSIQSPTVGTGIPKPMAAIKGTTKQTSTESSESSDVVDAVLKVNGNSDMMVQKTTQIVNPIAMNPLHNQLLNQTNNNNIPMTDSIHSASNNHATDSGVIYRPGMDSHVTDIYQMQSQLSPMVGGRKLENFNDPLLLNGNKFGTLSPKVNGMVQTSIATTIFEDDKDGSNVVPMRSLLRSGFSSCTTSPLRSNRLTNGYFDDNGQGYCSDGDALRKASSIRYSDIENGYLSEGANYFNMLRNSRPQMPSTIAEERCQTSREGNLDSADMESNSSKNSHGRDYWGNQQASSSPTSSRKDKTSSPSHSRRSTPSTKSSSRTKGVPQNFGYIKRTNGSSAATEMQTNAMLAGGRTAHVSAVPRSNKLKVSGGTQTTTADFQQKMQQQSAQYRSFSLTGPGAAQLSQSVKERFGSGTHSLPKGALDMHVFQHRMANRNSGKMNDGSMSDTQAYSDVKPEFGSYAMWLKHSSTTASRLSEGDSLESVSIVSSPGLSRNSKLIQSRESTPVAQQQQQQQPGQNSRLNRSNSIRSTKSEKLYPSMLSRGPDIETEPYYCLPVSAQSAVPWSQPTSPTPPTRGFGGMLSPTHNPAHRLTYPKKNDEVHGSQISLMSGGSSMYGSTTEEQRQANEVRRLKRELHDARDQVMSLSSQLSTNAHVVNAFEQSLQNMTNRLQQLTATTEKKESEITEMRQTIELLRKQSIQAGLTSAHMQSMGVPSNVNGAKTNGSPTKAPTNGQLEPQNGQNGSNMQRHHSTDSVCSINSNGSNGSSQDKKKKKGWLRSSFTKAFSRNAKIPKPNRQTSLSSNHSDSKSSLPPPTPQKQHLPHSPSKVSPHRYIPIVENAKPHDAIEVVAHPVVEDLKKQLREKDMVLTDIRLEALTQASQMETLKETVRTMRQEMMNLKQNNERLQRMVTTRSLAGSEASLGCPASPSGSIGESRRYSLAPDSGMQRAPLDLPQNLDETEEEDNCPPAPAPGPTGAEMSPTMERISISNEVLSTPAEDCADPVDGKKIAIAVFLGQSDAFPKFSEDINEYDLRIGKCKAQVNGFDSSNSSQTVIACTYISGKTTWQNLDYIVRKTFKDYLSKVDPGTNLGLNTDSITSYHLGEAKRGPEMGFPELLPCGYIIGHVKTLFICLQGVGSLAFESLIPRSIVHRYINLLSEHRRLILCGPSGTGKSYLARKLAEFLVAKSNRSPAESIATFNVDNKSSNLQQYLGTIAEQASINGAAEELPAVIILDNLHHASALGDVFSCLLSAGPAAKLPCIIGTMSQATCNTTNLQLHHNFRWVLTANHMEPVKGFLGRFLRRRLFYHELQTGAPQVQMEKVFKWLPSVWLHTNTFLENHSSSDVTIGPQLFLECPLDVDESQKWFVDLWNHQLAPYLVDAIKEGVQLYGRRGNSWTDPCLYIRETYPWKVTPTTVPTLRQITADDVGLDPGASGNMDSDPLLNMLQMLQQAAASENPDQDNSDCASLDSNFTHESAGAEQ